MNSQPLPLGVLAPDVRNTRDMADQIFHRPIETGRVYGYLPTRSHPPCEFTIVGVMAYPIRTGYFLRFACKMVSLLAALTCLGFGFVLALVLP